ncbi:hypothetical protein E2C01_055103 [Portunus trituberculatus]|uniref:Uncharacterized protein n=1 Tax=Portunus trituberculatus TaxID=210409 RepID=A0A5B7GLG0_PORTR|nr:hypothetical protein [Portunus trituberculatus]
MDATALHNSSPKMLDPLLYHDSPALLVKGESLLHHYCQEWQVVVVFGVHTTWDKSGTLAHADNVIVATATVSGLGSYEIMAVRETGHAMADCARGTSSVVRLERRIERVYSGCLGSFNLGPVQFPQAV